MDYSKAVYWLSARGVSLEESFADALRRMAVAYREKHKCTLDDVYALIGIRKQYILYWKNNPCSVQTKHKTKQNVIALAGEIFNLDICEREILANKAGLSLSAEDDFPEYLSRLLSLYPDKKNYLCDMAMLSERMFRYIKAGKFLRKEALLALGIALGLEIDELVSFIKKAGYTLSSSIPGDAVIKWLLENEKYKPGSPVLQINEVLDSLELPLLMTRTKNE